MIEDRAAANPGTGTEFLLTMTADEMDCDDEVIAALEKAKSQHQ